MINYLEGLSVYFTKGIADESIAFSSIGYYYCSYVELYYPLIAFMREDNNPNKPYSNLIELYRIWKSRLDKFESEEVVKRREEEIKKQIKELDDITILEVKTGCKPIGT